MKSCLFLLCSIIFLVKSENETQTCEKISVSWTNKWPKCKLHDYCFTLDKDRSHTKQFSTKTGYRIKASHDLVKNDFEIESEYEMKSYSN